MLIKQEITTEITNSAQEEKNLTSYFFLHSLKTFLPFICTVRPLKEFTDYKAGESTKSILTVLYITGNAHRPREGVCKDT